MLNFLELEQFVAFADCGTLSKAAEELHISQPTITRTMRRVEDAFGVSLFSRGKNRIELNETGKKAVEFARKLLDDAEHAVTSVQAFDRSLRTISVESCAPAPLWSLLPALSNRHPENAISSKIADIAGIIEDVSAGRCDIGILPFRCPDASLSDLPYVREKLSVCIPKSNPLSAKDALTMQQLNGFNCLLRDQIGFWTDLCQRKMPASRFLVQTDEFAFQELVRTSTLFSFVTDLANPQNEVPPGRSIVPLTDADADVTYHLVCRPQKQGLIASFAPPSGGRRAAPASHTPAEETPQNVSKPSRG